MLRISISAFFVSLLCVACGNEVNETASDTTAQKTCNQVKLNECLEERPGDERCYAKFSCSAPSATRGQSSRACRISAICE